MDKLQEDVYNEFHKLVENTMVEIKQAAKENRAIDFSQFSVQLSKSYANMNNYFKDARIRLKNPQKKGFF